MASDEFLMVVIAFTSVPAVFWYLFQRQNTVAKARLQRAESINRLIDKFGTAKEVIEFLQTEQGQKFLEDPAPTAENPRNRVLRFVQAGVVFLFLGFAFYMNASLFSNQADINYARKVVDLKFWGTLSAVLGAGLLVVAYVTSALVKKWRLDGREGKH